MWISNFAWSTPLRKSCTVLAAIFGAIAAFASAWPTLEPLLPAHRAYARDLTDHVEKVAENYANKNAAILRDVQIEQAEGKLDNLDTAKNNVSGDLFKWQIELNKSTTDESIKPMIQEQIRRLNGDLEKINGIKNKLNDQIKTLNAIKQKQ